MLVTSLFGLDLVNSPLEQGIMVAILTVCWAILCILVEKSVKLPKLEKRLQHDVKNRIVSLVHGILTFIMSCRIYAFSEESLDVNAPNDQSKNLLVCISLSYIIYDFVACCVYGLADTGLVLHHSFSILGYVSSLLSQYGSMVSIGGLFYAEISNVPMHIRMILKGIGLRYTKSYEWSENIYFALYIPSRGIFCPILLLLPSILSEMVPIGVKLICLLIVLQSVWYIWAMFGLISRKLKNRKQMKQKGVEFKWLEEVENLQRLGFYKKDTKQKIF